MARAEDASNVRARGDDASNVCVQLMMLAICVRELPFLR